MEVGITGLGFAEQLEWAQKRLGGELTIEDVYSDGIDIDVIGITKGKGWQGSIKRWGIKLLSHKNSKRRFAVRSFS